MPGTLDRFLSSLAPGRHGLRAALQVAAGERARVPDEAEAGLALGRVARALGRATPASTSSPRIATAALWAVQAKHYDPAYAIKKADVDSFLSESSRPEFTYRLLIATTDHLGADARSGRSTLRRSRSGRSSARSSTCWRSPGRRRSATCAPRSRSGRSRARTSAERSETACRDSPSADRGQLVMACGTGKTLVGPFLADGDGGEAGARPRPLALAARADAARVGDRRRVRLPRGLLRRDGHEGRAGRGRRLHLASLACRSRPTRHGSPASCEGVGRDEGRVRDLPVLAADRRRAERSASRRSTS